MGYITHFKVGFLENKSNATGGDFFHALEQSISDDDFGEMLAEDLECSLDEDDIMEEGELYSFSEPYKWYDHDYDMKAVSQMFPGHILVLYGEGEESGDIWKTYYKDGRMQSARANIVFDAYDEAKLK